MAPYDAGYGFAHMLVGLVDSLWPIAGPFIILGAVVWLFTWVSSLSRSDDV